LSACAAVAAGLQVVAGGGETLSEFAASSTSAGLASLWVVGTISHWALEMWRVEKLRSVNASKALVQQPAPVEDQRGEPEPDRYLTTRCGNLFDRVTGVLSVRDKRKRQYAEVVDVIGRYIIETPGGDDQVIMVDVSLGWWRLARYWRDDKSTAEAEWCGNGKPFTKPEYRALRHWIIGERLGYWRNARVPNQGWELTHRARAILRSEAQQAEPAPPRKVKITDQNVVAYVRAHSTHNL